MGKSAPQLGKSAAIAHALAWAAVIALMILANLLIAYPEREVELYAFGVVSYSAIIVFWFWSVSLAIRSFYGVREYRDWVWATCVLAACFLEFTLFLLSR